MGLLGMNGSLGGSRLGSMLGLLETDIIPFRSSKPLPMDYSFQFNFPQEWVSSCAKGVKVGVKVKANVGSRLMLRLLCKVGVSVGLC